MVGVVDPVAGTFERHKRGAIPLDVDVAEDVAPSAWCFRSASVSHIEADPTGRAESWRFEESHTIVARGTHRSRREVVDPVAVAHAQYDQIRRWAEQRGYATDSGVLQGFGFITATYQAAEVVNLASREPGQEFVLDGGWERAANLEAFVHPGVTGGPAPRPCRTRSSSCRSPAGRRYPAGWAKSPR